MARHKATSANIIRVLATVLSQCGTERITCPIAYSVDLIRVRPGEDGQFYRRFWAGQDDPRGDRRD